MSPILWFPWRPNWMNSPGLIRLKAERVYEPALIAVRILDTVTGASLPYNPVYICTAEKSCAKKYLLPFECDAEQAAALKRVAMVAESEIFVTNA